MRDGHGQDLALFVRVGEQSVRGLDSQSHRLRHELEAGVAKEGSRQQPGFAGDLETVADGDDRSAAFSVRHAFGHDRTEAGDGAGAQVVAVAEPARKNDDIRAGEIVILVPEILGLFAERVDHRVIRVVVAVGTGKSGDAEFHHAAFTLAISKSSVTGLASSFWHIAFVCAPASSASLASSSRTTCRPTWASLIPLKPRLCSASATALPCGSRMPRRGTM